MQTSRTLQLAVLVALAACATGDDSFRDVRSARLRLMYAQRQDLAALDAALDRVLTSAPRRSHVTAVVRSGPQAPQGQQPHLDQRLPPQRRDGQRSFQHDWQPLETSVTVGVGEVQVHADGTVFDDEADAVFVRAHVENGRGTGIDFSTWNSESTLFDDRMMSDGVSPHPAQAQLTGAEVYPHVRVDAFDDGALLVPVRVGAFLDWQSLEHGQADVERQWCAVGPRVVVEPTWTVLTGGESELQLFSSLGGDAGPAWFGETFRNGSSDDVVPRWSVEFAAGVRGRYGDLFGELGCRLRHTTFGETDGDLFGNPGRTELQQRQLFLGVGVTW